MTNIPTREDEGSHISPPLQDVIRQLEQQTIPLDSILPLENIIHRTFDGFILINPAQQIIYASPNVERLFGYRSEDLLSSSLEILIPDESVNIHRGHVKEFCLGKQRTRPMKGRLRIIDCKRKDGTTFPAEVTITKSLANNQQGPMFMGAFIRDMTERVMLEQAVRESEELHRVILSSISDSVFLTDEQGHFEFVCPNVARIFGYSPSEVEATGSIAAVLGEEIVQRANDLRIGEELANVEQTVTAKNGEKRTLLVTKKRVQIRKATFLYSCRDITELGKAEAARKQAEERLRKSELFLKESQRIAHVGSWELDLTNGQTIWSDEMFRICGYEPGAFEPTGERTLQLIHPEDRERAAAATIQTLEQDAPYNIQKRIIRPDGEIRHILSHGELIHDAQGNPIKLIRIFADITERYQAEQELHTYRTNLEALVEERTRQLRESEAQQREQYEALRLSEEKYRSLFETMVQGVVYQNADGVITSANPAAERILGLTFSQMTGRTSIDPRWRAVREDGSVFPGEIHPAMVALRTGKPAQAIMGVFNPQKNDFSWININAIPEFYRGSTIPYQVYTTFEDITERKMVEQMLAQAKEAAETANRAKSVFLANMSHELRTPLNAILGFAQLLRRDQSLTNKHREYLNIICRSGRHLLDLISDVLEMSKIEAGRMTLRSEAFNLYDMLVHLRETMDVLAQKEGIEFYIDWDSSVPPYVQTDGRKLQQVLLNLINNAIRFTPEGEVRVRITADAAGSAKTARLFFEIKDTGIGIAPEEVPNLFEPFVQTQSGFHALGGTGLGLPISQQFVRLMGGEIDVVSQKGNGATFSFSVEVEIVSETAVSQSHSIRKVIGLAPDQPAYRILIVDDQFESRHLLAQLLESIGFQIRQAADGYEALAQYRAWNPHLIWMDIRMPGVDGLETTRQIRTMPRGRDAVIIALTAHVFPEERQQILAAGCNDFVHKPIYESVIFEKLAQHLQVQYVYEVISAAAEPPTALDPELLAPLSPTWLDQFRQAARRARRDQAMILIQQIAETEPGPAQLFAQLVDDFQFDKIVTLIEENRKYGDDK